MPFYYTIYVQYNTNITRKSTCGNGAECYVIPDGYKHKKPRKVLLHEKPK
jgi:hypothetical protein